MTATTIFATNYEAIRKTDDCGILCTTTPAPLDFEYMRESSDICPPHLQADNQETGTLALIGAIFRQAYNDYKELKKAETVPKTHRQAKSAIRKMERTFLDPTENVLLLLYCSGLNIDPAGIYRAFPIMLAKEEKNNK